VLVKLSMQGENGRITNQTMVVPSNWSQRRSALVTDSVVMFNGRVVRGSDVVVRRSGDTSRVYILGQLVTQTTIEPLRRHVVVYNNGTVLAEADFTKSSPTEPWGFAESVGANLEEASPCWWLAIQLAGAVTAMTFGCGTLDPLICGPAFIAYIGLQGQWNEQCGRGNLRQAAFPITYKRPLFLGVQS
jgi:hypothetical protein